MASAEPTAAAAASSAASASSSSSLSTAAAAVAAAPAAAAALPAVHVLWDADTFPANVSDTASPSFPALLPRLQSLIASHGRLSDFVLLSSAPLDDTIKQQASAAGIIVEEGGSASTETASDTMLLTRLLKLTLQQQQPAPAAAASSQSSHPCVIVLSNLHALSASLTLMRQSGVFSSIVLLHGPAPAASPELIASASTAIAIEDLMRTPTAQMQQHGASNARTPQSATLLASPGQSPPMNSAFSHLQLHLSPPDESAAPPPNSGSAAAAPSLLGMHPGFLRTPQEAQGSSMVSISPHHSLSATAAGGPGSAANTPSQALLPTPSPRGSTSSTPSVRMIHSPLNSTGASSAGAGGKSFFGKSRTAPSSPTQQGVNSATNSMHQHVHARSFFPSNSANVSPSSRMQQQQQQQMMHAQPQLQQQLQQQPSQQLQQPQSFLRSGSSGGAGPGGSVVSGVLSHPHVSPARARACVLAYHRIIAYCEQEKLIPRESVLKKRLVDSRADLGAAGITGAAGVDFEEFLFVVTQVTQVGLMEGEAPQRIVWPRGADGTARHFPCADFFTPQARLSPAQNAELMEFLYRVQPEVERGRFGFATYLARHGPDFIRLMPHGVLVELTQLLLNQKVLLFRKGKVSVASKSEAIEAQSLGQFFAAADFITPAQSRTNSPGSVALAAPLHASPPEQSLWDDKPLSMTSPHADEASIWRTSAASAGATQQLSARHIDRTLLHQRRGSVGGGGGPGGSPLQYSPFSSPLGPSGTHLPHHGHSFSLPGSRLPSPSPPENVSTMHARLESIIPPAQQQQSQQQQDFSKLASLPGQRKSISSLQPLPQLASHSRSLFDPALPSSTHTAVVASAFDPLNPTPQMHVPEFGLKPAQSDWLKQDDATSSHSNSVQGSRRSSLSDVDASWRNSGLEGRAGGGSLNNSLNSAMPRYEQSTGFAGESMDACDPAAVLSTKLAQLNRDAIQSISAYGDELSRFTASVQFRPAFHYEKGGAAHTPEWVSVLTFCVGSKKYQMRSQTHSKKDMAKADVAMRALQAIEDRTLSQAPHVDTAEAGADAIDSVLDLARLLSFLQQAPVVYYLTRLPSASNSRPNRDGRRGSTGQLSFGPPVPQSQHGSHPALWTGTTRIQVKSVNILTGEAQPTVSASTPFTHTVHAATSKADAKEQIAASLLKQIERARVVNPALFTVLSAANSTRPLQPPQQLMASAQTAATSVPLTLDSIWSAPAPLSHAPPAPISAPHPLPPVVDISRTGAVNSTSLFSTMTPVSGHAFQGISAITGMQTPMATPMATPNPNTPQSQQASSSAQQRAVSLPTHIAPPPMLRSVSECLNEEAEQTSRTSAECALETPNSDK